MKRNAVSGGGICAALCIALLFAATYLPAKIAFVFATSIVMGICILRYRTKTALISYIAVSVISLFLVPNKVVGFAYIVIFGIYPIIKLYIEKIRNIITEYILKAIVWNIHIFFSYVVLVALGQNTLFNIGQFWIWLCVMVVFLAYDLVFGIVINSFYRTYSKYLN